MDFQALNKHKSQIYSCSYEKNDSNEKVTLVIAGSFLTQSSAQTPTFK